MLLPENRVWPCAAWSAPATVPSPTPATKECAASPYTWLNSMIHRMQILRAMIFHAEIRWTSFPPLGRVSSLSWANVAVSEEQELLAPHPSWRWFSGQKMVHRCHSSSSDSRCSSRSRVGWVATGLFSGADSHALTWHTAPGERQSPSIYGIDHLCLEIIRMIPQTEESSTTVWVLIGSSSSSQEY